jgi:hypothetical protein
MEGFLARNADSRRTPAQVFLERLRRAPRARLGTPRPRPAGGSCSLVETLSGLVGEIGRLASQIAGALRAHPDGALFKSLFVDPKSSLTAATLTAEIGDCACATRPATASPPTPG